MALANSSAGRVGRASHTNRAPLRFHRYAAASAHYFPPPGASDATETRRRSLPQRARAPRTGCHNARLSVDSDQRPAWSAEPRACCSSATRARPGPRRPPRPSSSGSRCTTSFRRECVALTMAGDDCRDGRLAARELAAARRTAACADGRPSARPPRDRGLPLLPDVPRGGAAACAGVRSARERSRAAARGHRARARRAQPSSSRPRTRARPGRAAARHAADRYVRESDTLYRRLVRHLSDEEDLIIPLLLERGA